MRKLLKKSFKLAGAGSGGLEKEALSVTSKCKMKQKMLM